MEEEEKKSLNAAVLCLSPTISCSCLTKLLAFRSVLKLLLFVEAEVHLFNQNTLPPLDFQLAIYFIGWLMLTGHGRREIKKERVLWLWLINCISLIFLAKFNNSNNNNIKERDCLESEVGSKFDKRLVVN